MAHFAQITNGIVTNCIVVSNDVVGADFPASEIIGQEFIKNHKYEGEWLQTSYNGNFRKQYAGIGYTYDAIKDQFVAPQPYPSWSLDDNNDWQPPVEQPSEPSYWNEATGSWILL